MRCKAGDMALITAGPNVGALVDVMRFIGNYDGSGRDYWEVKALPHVTGQQGGIRHAPGFVGVCRDAAMSPLPRDPDVLPAPKVEEPIAA